jgi:methylmalonyl-CoA epimerase
MKILGVDHIGMVAADATAARHLFESLLGLPVELEEVYGERDLLTFFGAGGTAIEVCTSLSSGSETEKALALRGEHLEHLALAVDDLDAALVELAAAGVGTTAAGITPGAAGTRTAVLDPQVTGGVLLELVEHVVGSGAEGRSRRA